MENDVKYKRWMMDEEKIKMMFVVKYQASLQTPMIQMVISIFIKSALILI